MVKSFVNAFFGGIGRTLGKFVVYIIIALIFFFIYENANAAAIYGTSSCTSTKYNIEKQDQTVTSGTTSTSYNINWKSISFYGTENLESNTYYDMVITFRSTITNSILNSFIDGSVIGNDGINGIHFLQTSSLCGSYNGEIPLTYYSISGTKLTVRFLTGPTMIDYWYFLTNFYFNGSNGINTVVFTPVDLSGSGGIIENANDNTNTIINNQDSNTQDIIDNQQQNAQDIIDNQTQNTADMIESASSDSANSSNYIVASEFEANYSCGNNLISMSDYHLINNSTWSYISSGADFIRLKSTNVASSSNFPFGYSFNVVSGKTYYISFDTTNDSNALYQVYLYKTGWTNTVYKFFSVRQNNITFVADYTGAMYFQLYMLKDNPNNANFYLRNLRIRVCENRSDIINNSITDPSEMDTNIFSTWWSNFNPGSNPLGNVITLPITLAQKIVSFNSNSCSAINLGSLMGTNLVLPCFTLYSVLPNNATTLINTIDVIMSISLLVVIIKNSYETIANLISLGGENKVKSHFRLPTPLEFMSSILNGNGYAEYVDYR